MPEKPEVEEEESNFTHVGIRKDTKLKITILAKVLGRKQYRLLEIWVDDAWKLAKKAGLVTDAMLDPEDTDNVHWVGMTDEEQRGMKKLLKRSGEDPKEKK